METVSRREFLRLAVSGAAAAGTIYLPGVGVNWRPQPLLLRGLGMGINLSMHEDARADSLAAALNVFNPRVALHWRRWPPSAHPGFVPAAPMSEGGAAPAPMTPQEVAGFQWALAQVGGDLSTRCWLLGNEPQSTPWSPGQYAQAMVEQVAVFRDLGLAPVIYAPNENITTPDHLAYIYEWRNEAARRGLAYTLAIHIYEHRLEMLDFAWLRFKQTVSPGETMIVTECGAGPNRSMQEWLTVMPWFYSLLSNDPQVVALAPFAAYPHDGEPGQYPGFMSFDGEVNALGQQWLAEAAQM